MRYYILAALILSPLFAALTQQHQRAYVACHKTHSAQVCINILK